MLPELSQMIVAGCVGIMLFFTVAVAPSIFIVLPAEWAAIYVRAFFPKYYLSLGVLSLAALVTASQTNTMILLGVCASILFLSLFWLTPAINEARDQKQDKKFHVLHITSVALNVLALLLFIVCLGMKFFV